MAALAPIDYRIVRDGKDSDRCYGGWAARHDGQGKGIRSGSGWDKVCQSRGSVLKRDVAGPDSCAQE